MGGDPTVSSLAASILHPHRCDPRADGGGNMQVPFASPMKVMLSGAVYQSEGKCSHVYNLYFINKKKKHIEGGGLRLTFPWEDHW